MLIIQCVSECYKIQEMCYKAVHRCFLVFDSISDQNKTQEICVIIVSLYSFLIVHCPSKYITQKLSDEVVDDFLAAFKLIPDWLVTSKVIKKLYTALYSDDGYSFLMKILVMSDTVVIKLIL